MNAQTKRKLPRSIFGAALGLAALNLPAATAAGPVMTKTIFEKPIQYDEDISAYFNADRDLGRAWIEVALTPQVEGDEPPESQIVKEAVKGLYYDRDQASDLSKGSDAGYLRPGFNFLVEHGFEGDRSVSPASELSDAESG